MVPNKTIKLVGPYWSRIGYISTKIKLVGPYWSRIGYIVTKIKLVGPYWSRIGYIVTKNKTYESSVRYISTKMKPIGLVLVSYLLHNNKRNGVHIFGEY